MMDVGSKGCQGAIHTTLEHSPLFPQVGLMYTESTGYWALPACWRAMLRNAIRPLLLIGLAHVAAVGQSSRAVAPGQNAGQDRAKATAPRGSATFNALVPPFLAKNCYACHNQKLSSGALD